MQPNSYHRIIYSQTGNGLIQIRKPAVGSGGRVESFVVQVVPIAITPGAFAEDANGGVIQDFDWFLQSNEAYQGEKTSLHARVYLGCGGRLDRPVFILEGFDPSGSYGADDLFNSFYRVPNGVTPNRDFLRSLYAQGCDLIFVNWNNNHAAIEANALLLETLIDYTNSRCDNLRMPGTVIGVSMGGLIARFALRSMENKGKQHRVGNYFSYDSPHQGAFIPIGLQFIMETALNDFESIHFIADLFSPSVSNTFAAARAVAAAQMMVVKYSRNPFHQAANINIRNAFAAKLEALGYPQQCQNHAIAMGNSAGALGQNQAFQPHDRLLTAWQMVF